MIQPLGYVIFRGEKKLFGIKEDDRRRHIYIIGKTGSGKTTLLENMMIFDIENKNGFAFIDAHGDTCERLLKFVPKERIEDVIYFNPADLNYPFSFNILSQVPWEFRHILVSGLMSVFKKIWVDAWSSRMEYILTNTLLALVEFPDSTLLDVNRMLADKNFREKVIEKLKDPVVKNFWTQEYSRYTQAFQVEAIAPIQNKIGQFLTSPLIRNIIGQKESKIDFRKLMDEKKIFIANISKGLIGEDNAALLGAMLVTKIQLAAMSRADIPEHQRVDFYLYVDEFQNFATDSFINILSEARKYHLSLILANQYLDQLPDKIKTAIIGNIGTIIAFRVGPLDAEILAKEFEPYISAIDLLNLPKYTTYIKMIVDGITTQPFIANTLPPRELPKISYEEEIINFTRSKYCATRGFVEKQIKDRFGYLPGKEGEKEQFLAKCWNCGKEIYVDFPPTREKPVFCESCQGSFTPEISLKKSIEKGLVQPFKTKKDIKDEKNLKE
jgi:CxxC-x17-CxxC domain-containing protein